MHDYAHAGMHTCVQTGRQAQTDRLTDRQNRQTARQTHGQTGRQAGRQADKRSYDSNRYNQILTDPYTHTCHACRFHSLDDGTLIKERDLGPAHQRLQELL